MEQTKRFLFFFFRLARNKNDKEEQDHQLSNQIDDIIQLLTRKDEK